MAPPNLELYLVATLLMCLSPGPNVLLMISLGLRHGTVAVLRGVAGIVAASAIFLAISALGVVAVLTASPRLFAAIRYVGAAYLLYVGARMLLGAIRHATSPGSAATAGEAPSGSDGAGASRALRAPNATVRGEAFWNGFVTHLSNPKAVIFWSAILPPFVAMDRPVGQQILTLGVTGIAIDAAVLAGYGASAAALRPMIAGPGAHRWLEGLAGAFFLVVGAWLLAAQ